MAGARRPAVPWFVALAAVAVGVLLVTGGFFAGAGIAAAAATAAEAGSAQPKALGTVRLAPAEPDAADGFRTCSIDGAASQPAALDFHGYVIDSATGEVRFDRQSDAPAPTASVMKLLTASAAVSVLGPDRRLPTRVYAGATPGSVVIVGGGDVTLSSLEPGSPTYYDGATAFVSDLAAQTRSALGGAAVTSVQVDDSLFTGDTWHPTWLDADRTDGYASPVTALMIDGDRTVPQSNVSARTLEPSERAGAAFASQLGLPASAVEMNGRAPEGAALLAEVWSQPVSQLVSYVLQDSDNILAEALARLVAIEQGDGSTFGAINASTTRAMAALGLDTTGLVLADGSGLSGANRVPPEFVVSLLQLIDGRDPSLAPVLANLPASAQTGTLDARFDPGATGVPSGGIRAKTGFINEVYALAGFMRADDGTSLTFAFFVVGPVAFDDRSVLDGITAQAFACGEALADW